MKLALLYIKIFTHKILSYRAICLPDLAAARGGAHRTSLTD